MRIRLSHAAPLALLIVGGPGCYHEVSTDPAAVGLGGLAGAITGLLGSLVAELARVAAKRLRNLRLVRHSEPIEVVKFEPFVPLFAIVGLIAGLCWTWRLDGDWSTGAIAGFGLPAFASAMWLGWALSQLRR